MTARDHATPPLRHRIAALFALLALAAAVLGAHAAWPPAEGEPSADAAIPFGGGDDTELVDVAMDDLAHRAVAVAKNRRAFLLGPPGHAMSEIELPGRPRAIAIDPVRQLALIGADKRRGLLLLDMNQRVLLPQRITTGRHIDVIASAGGIALALQRNHDTLHFIDLDTRAVVDTLRIRGAKLADAALHAGRAYVINRHADNGRRARGGNGNRGGDDEDDDDDRDEDRDDGQNGDQNHGADNDRGDDQNGDRDDDRDDDGNDRDDNGLRGELLTIDLAGREIVNRTPLSRHADALLIDPGLNLAAVSLRERKRVQLIDLTDGTVTQEHVLPHKIAALALQPRLHQLVITLDDADQVALLDIESATLASPYATLTEPQRATVSTRYNLALVISGEAHDTLELLPLPAPAPALTALSPAEAVIGDPDLNDGLDLTLTGGPFFDGAAVHFGDERYTARWHDFDRLTTRLPADRLTTPGETEVRVENPHPSAGPSEALTFTVIQPNPVPVLTALSPDTIELTDPPSAATVTLGGEGFIEATVAHLGAHPLATTLLSETSLSVTIPADLLTEPGQAVVTLFNPAPGGGTSAPATIRLESPGPRIDAFTPAEGPAGTLVTLTGRNFDALTPANNLVRFGPSTTPAAIAYADPTTLRVVVPLDAGSGPITLTTADGEALSTQPFTLQQQESFAIEAAPAAATLVPGGQAYVMIQLQSLGLSEYRQPIQLAVDGLPSGLTAAFTEGSLTLRRPATLILTADPEATAGDFPITVTASGREGQTQVTHTAQLQATILAAGTTTVVGRILNAADDRPMAGVGVQLGEAYTTTDAAGFYLFADPPLSGDQVILIDGGTLNTETTQYPSRIAMPVMIEPGRQNPVLTSYLSAIDTADKVTITPGVGTDVTFAELPNFALRIPEGATLTGWDGTPITEINVRTASPDRLPIKPLPDGVTATTIYLYYFFRAGGAHPSEPIPVTMPNEMGLAPGDQADLWYYDESPVPDPTSNRWRRQGSATVSADGLSITTDPGVGIPKFCCGASTFVPRTFDPVPPRCGPKAGNPVDLATGSGSVLEEHSLGINGLFPVRLTCGYGSTTGSGSQSGLFGPGIWLNTEWFLRGGANGTLGLISPQGALYAFTEDGPGHYRIGPGNRPEAFGMTARWAGRHAAVGYVDFPNGTTFEFDMTNWRNSPLSRVVDPTGNRIGITRDDRNRPIGITDGAGRPYRIEYNEYGYIDAITDPAERTQHYGYQDISGSRHFYLSGVTNFAEVRTGYEWSIFYGNNALKSVPSGIQTLFQYDDQGRITDERIGQLGLYSFPENSAPPGSDTNPDILNYDQIGMDHPPVPPPICHLDNYGHLYCSQPQVSAPYFTQQAHHAFRYQTIGEKVVETEHTDPNGNRATYRFDGRNNNTRIVDALGRITTKEYLASNNKPRALTDPLGRSTYFTYDTNGNRNSVRDAAGHTTLAYYDPVTNNPERITDPLGRETVLDYDLKGRLIRAVNAAGETAEVTYTDRGQIQTITDPAGNAWTFAYDDFGNLTAATDPEGRTARYRYDAASRVIEAIDPLGRSTRYAYDPMDRITEVTNPKGETTTLGYRADGRLATVTDAKGALIETNEYDMLGRLITRTGALGHTERFTYDRNDNLITYTDAAGRLTTFGYDALDRLIGMVDADGRSTEYQYDLAGNPVWVADSESGDTRYDYDELDRLVRKISPRGTVEYAYDAAGQLTARRVNGLSLTTYGYDAAGRVTTIDHDGRRATYRYDAAGRLSEKTLPNGITQRYDHGPAGDLLSIAYLDASGAEVDRIDYEYDAAGNRVRRTRARTDTTPESLFNAVYDEANRMLSYNGYPLSYDDNGNLIRRDTEQGAVNYAWDARGQLIAIDGPNGTARFNYDHQGRRIEKSVNGVTTGYLYDGAQAVAELAGSALGATYHTGLMIDEVLGRYAAAGDRQLLSDALGSVIGLADEGGWVTDEYAYSPFGESAHVGADDQNSLGYTGREDDGTGLYYYRARYYDPGLKRFVSSDPIGLLGGVNSYAYVSENPISLTDPFGLFSANPVANFIDSVKYAYGMTAPLIGEAWQKTSSDFGDFMRTSGGVGTFVAALTIAKYANKPIGGFGQFLAVTGSFSGGWEIGKGIDAYYTRHLGISLGTNAQKYWADFLSDALIPGWSCK